MPAELDVDKEQVKMLVQAIGCREAARQMGLKEGTVLQWASRGNWLAEIRKAAEPKRPALPASMQKRTVVGVISPADALANTLRERLHETRLGQSKYLSRASTKLAEVPDKELLAQALTGKALADMTAKVWPEQQQPTVRLSIYGSQELPVIDVTPAEETEQ